MTKLPTCGGQSGRGVERAEEGGGGGRRVSAAVQMAFV